MSLVEVDHGATRGDTSGTSDISNDISSSRQGMRKTSLHGRKMTCVSVTTTVVPS